MGLSHPRTLKSHTWKCDGWTLNHYPLQYVESGKQMHQYMKEETILFSSMILTSKLALKAQQQSQLDDSWMIQLTSRLSQSGRVPVPVSRVDGCPTD